MNEKQLRKLQEEWYEENAPLGKMLGYPECCIKAFCDQPPASLKGRAATQIEKDRFKAGCIDGQFTGFVPCAEHAKDIIEGKVTLVSLINNRDGEFPAFPYFGLR